MIFVYYEEKNLLFNYSKFFLKITHLWFNPDFEIVYVIGFK